MCTPTIEESQADFSLPACLPLKYTHCCAFNRHSFLHALGFTAFSSAGIISADSTAFLQHPPLPWHSQPGHCNLLESGCCCDTEGSCACHPGFSLPCGCTWIRNTPCDQRGWFREAGPSFLHSHWGHMTATHSTCSQGLWELPSSRAEGCTWSRTGSFLDNFLENGSVLTSNARGSIISGSKVWFLSYFILLDKWGFLRALQKHHPNPRKVSGCIWKKCVSMLRSGSAVTTDP